MKLSQVTLLTLAIGATACTKPREEVTDKTYPVEAQAYGPYYFGMTPTEFKQTRHELGKVDIGGGYAWRGRFTTDSALARIRFDKGHYYTSEFYKGSLQKHWQQAKQHLDSLYGPSHQVAPYPELTQVPVDSFLVTDEWQRGKRRVWLAITNPVPTTYSVSFAIEDTTLLNRASPSPASASR